MLPVWMCNCDQPDEYSVAQYCVPALCYIAQDQYTQKGESHSGVNNNEPHEARRGLHIFVIVIPKEGLVSTSQYIIYENNSAIL